MLVNFTMIRRRGDDDVVRLFLRGETLGREEDVIQATEDSDNPFGHPCERRLILSSAMGWPPAQ